MTTIYLMRHSKPLKVNYENSNDNLQIQNEKNILSIEGERIAKEVFDNEEFRDIDSVYSSNYVRTIATAKYIAEKYNLDINVVDDLGERKFGINSWDELPKDFEFHQFEDENYKLPNGESHKEVRERILKALNNILNEHRNERIIIIGHSTAFAILLKTWCEVYYTDSYKFKGKIFFDGKWNYCETFKLEFDDNNNLVDIKNIKFD